jgi:hypothetical protein
MNRNFLPKPSSRSNVFAGVLLLLVLSCPLFAEAVTVRSFRGDTEVQRAATPGKWFPVRVGLELNPGDTVRVPKGFGRAELRLSDGSKLMLTKGTQLKIRETAPNKSFDLNFGRVRSIVKKLRPGSKFEMKTPLAAASVRGTDFGTEYDPDTNSGSVEVGEGAVDVTGADGRTVTVPAGMRLDFLSGQPTGAPAPQGGGAGGDAAQAEVRREVGLSMSKEEVMAAAAEEMRRAEYQEGKTLVDVNGRRVRLEEYIIRAPRELPAADQDKAFKFVVLNERDDRFDYFYYRGVFNTTLPEDLSVALQDINGKLGSVAPDYYLTEYEMGQSNTSDFIKDNASGGHMVKIELRSDGTYLLTDASNSSNARVVDEDEEVVVDGVTYHKIYDPVNDRFQTLNEDQFAAGDFRPAVYDPSNDSFRSIVSGDTYWRGRYNSYSHVINNATKQSYARKSNVTNTLAVDLDADFTYAGGTALTFTETPTGADRLHNRVTIFYGDGTKEVYDTYIISDEGEVAPASAFAGLNSGAAFKAELLKWNYQQIATATEFQGRKIDLVAEPKILIKAGLIK